MPQHPNTRRTNRSIPKGRAAAHSLFKLLKFQLHFVIECKLAFEFCVLLIRIGRVKNSAEKSAIEFEARAANPCTGVRTAPTAFSNQFAVPLPALASIIAASTTSATIVISTGLFLPKPPFSFFISSFNAIKQRIKKIRRIHYNPYPRLFQERRPA